LLKSVSERSSNHRRSLERQSSLRLDWRDVELPDGLVRSDGHGPFLVGGPSPWIGRAANRTALSIDVRHRRGFVRS
jgi:hypothetical protein